MGFIKVDAFLARTHIKHYQSPPLGRGLQTWLVQHIKVWGALIVAIKFIVQSQNCQTLVSLNNINLSKTNTYLKSEQALLQNCSQLYSSEPLSVALGIVKSTKQIIFFTKQSWNYVIFVGGPFNYTIIRLLNFIKRSSLPVTYIQARPFLKLPVEVVEKPCKRSHPGGAWPGYVNHIPLSNRGPTFYIPSVCSHTHRHIPELACMERIKNLYSRDGESIHLKTCVIVYLQCTYT